jgi:hypothetical protein
MSKRNQVITVIGVFVGVILVFLVSMAGYQVAKTNSGTPIAVASPSAPEPTPTRAMSFPDHYYHCVAAGASRQACFGVAEKFGERLDSDDRTVSPRTAASFEGESPLPTPSPLITPMPEPTDAVAVVSDAPSDNNSNTSDNTHPGMDFAISNPRGSLVSITRCLAKHDPDDNKYVRVLITVENDSDRKLDDYGIEVEDVEGENIQGADIDQPGGTSGSDGFTSIAPHEVVTGAVEVPVPMYGTLLEGGRCSLGRLPSEFIATPQY